jgi:putative flippase GtrA
MKFIKFLGVGGAATAIQYGILMLLVELASVTPVVASTVGYIVSGLVNYTLNYHFTFGSSARHGVAGSKFIVVALVGLLINSSIVFLMNELGGLHYMASQVIATVCALVWNFTAHKCWTYRSAKDDLSDERTR